MRYIYGNLTMLAQYQHVSYFQCYIHIRPLAVYIVGVELLFASAFQNMAFAAYFTVV